MQLQLEFHAYVLYAGTALPVQYTAYLKKVLVAPVQVQVGNRNILYLFRCAWEVRKVKV